MKKFIKGLTLAGVAGLIALTTACTEEQPTPGSGAGQSGTGVYLTDAGRVDDEIFDIDYESGLDYEWEWDSEFISPEFMSFSGTVREINPFYDLTEDGEVAVEGRYFVLVQGEEDADGYAPMVNFAVDENTLLLLDGELEPGMKVRAFHEFSLMMILIYPPQHNARVLVSDPLPYNCRSTGDPLSAESVIVDRFDENWNIQNPFYEWHLEIGEDTEIIFQDGEAFEGELDELVNRALVLIGTTKVVGLSYPVTVVPPDKIVILFERAEHPMLWLTDEDLIVFDVNDFGVDGGIEIDNSWGGGLQLTQEDLDIMWDNMFDPETVQIIVNNEFIDAPKPFIDRVAGRVMVPVAAIAQALGYVVVGESYDMVIAEYGAPARAIAFVEGLDSYMIGRMDTVSLGVPPTFVNGVLFVPMEFFGQVIEAGAWISGGEVVITNLPDSDMH